MEQTHSRPAKPQNKGTRKLFQNPVLEWLSRTHIAIPISIFVIASITMLYWAASESLLGGLSITGIFLLGLLVFTWVEYMVHRHVFHMITNTQLKEKIQYASHGIHHDFPRDKTRLAMPPLVSAAIVAFLYLVFKLLMGNYVFAFLPGFITGYSAYLFVHYIVHAYQPPKNIFKSLWVNHGIHHYKDSERAFGVSSPLWDYIYRTMPKTTK